MCEFIKGNRINNYKYPFNDAGGFGKGTVLEVYESELEMEVRFDCGITTIVSFDECEPIQGLLH